MNSMLASTYTVAQDSREVSRLPKMAVGEGKL